MSIYLGIDTSNYTTSCALYDESNHEIIMQKQLLKVKQGEKGLRQNDAVFQHIQNLPDLLKKLKINEYDIKAVGVSARPRDMENSYMPCFIVGENFAKIISYIKKIPCYYFSHQCGHIAAAAYSSGHTELLNSQFIAFHISGGTTEALLVTPDNKKIIKCEIIARSLDLKSGQAIDRVGVALGLDFPAGKKLDELSRKSQAQFTIKPTLKGYDCCLSGIENKCLDMIDKDIPKEDVALYCITYIKNTLDAMTERLLKKYGDLPLLFAGGVMSNSIIKEYMTKKYGANFALPEFSSDNAGGIAYLASLINKKRRYYEQYSTDRITN